MGTFRYHVYMSQHQEALSAASALTDSYNVWTVSIVLTRRPSGVLAYAGYRVGGEDIYTQVHLAHNPFHSTLTCQLISRWRTVNARDTDEVLKQLHDLVTVSIHFRQDAVACAI